MLLTGLLLQMAGRSGSCRRPAQRPLIPHHSPLQVFAHALFDWVDLKIMLSHWTGQVRVAGVRQGSCCWYAAALSRAEGRHARGAARVPCWHVSACSGSLTATAHTWILPT